MSRFWFQAGLALFRNRRQLKRRLIESLRTSALIERWPPLQYAVPSHLVFDLAADLSMHDSSRIGLYSEVVITNPDAVSPIAGSLHIGERSHIGTHGNVRAAGGKIEIGRNVMVAQHVSLIASNHRMDRDILYQDQCWDTEKTGITICDNVWIGAGCIILPGVTVGNGAIVGAGSVVNKSVPSFELWAGVPAVGKRIIR